MELLLAVYGGALVLVSLITFIIYGADKKRAKQIHMGKQKMRIKEKVLLGFAAFGGAIGAFFGRIVFHHKTNKAYFSIVILLSLVLQLAVLALIILVMGGIVK